MRRSVVLVAAIMAATVLGGCGDDEEVATETTIGQTTAEDAKPPVVSVKTSEYGFDVPTQFTGGLVTLELDNSRGQEAHEAGLVRLEQGKTIADLQQALRQDGGRPPSWLVSAGGPGPVPPGGKSTYTANLEPGTYAFICFVHSPDGQSHLAKGMLASATVIAGPTGTLPRADTTVVARDYEFTNVEGLRSGSQTVRVENQGQLDHNWMVFGLRPGKTAQDVATFLGADGAPPGPPPFVGTPGLVGTLPRGGEATRALELQPGSYALICVVRDADGRAHYQKGMVKQFSVG
jgi:hypothetical protein